MSEWFQPRDFLATIFHKHVTRSPSHLYDFNHCHRLPPPSPLASNDKAVVKNGIPSGHVQIRRKNQEHLAARTQMAMSFVRKPPNDFIVFAGVQSGVSI